jgi:hypothetical protein
METTTEGSYLRTIRPRVSLWGIIWITSGAVAVSPDKAKGFTAVSLKGLR